jgi:adenosylhomocysteine nucleosidase
MATDVSTPLVLFALEREAAPFRRRGLPVHIRVSGIGQENAQNAAQIAIFELKPSRVIAAGFCGALDPSLKVGDVVMSQILTVDRLVGDPVEKARYFAQTRIRVVDMESAAIAKVCAERGIPFTAVRAVSDTSDTALSPELVQLLSGGEVSIRRAILALLRRPSLLKEFLRLSRDTKLAADQLATALASLLAGT